MGLDAEVIAIGPYSEEVLPAMEYGPERYRDVQKGQSVIVHVFIACTSEESYELAEAFGVGAFELGKHHLEPEHANIDKLVSRFGQQDVDQFKLLRANGFSFYYLPNA